MLGQQLGGALADEADAQAEKHAVERGGAGFRDLREQGVGGFLADAFEPEQLRLGQRVDVGHGVDELVLEQLGDQGFAEAFDVHDAARGEVKQRARDPGRAGGIDAAVVGFALGALDLGTADRAAIGKGEEAGAAGLVGENGDDLGDDVAAALHTDGVADEQAERGDLVGVVEGGAGDGDAADRDGREHRDRGELAGAAHLDLDVLDHRDAEAGGELIGHCPAGGLAGVAEAALDGRGVDLDDDAVDFVAEAGSVGFRFPDEGDEPVEVADGLAVRVDAEAGGGEGIERFGLAGEEWVAFGR